MRYLTSGLLLALIFGLVPPAAADGGSLSGTVPGFTALSEWISSILDWLGFNEDLEPNGIGTILEPDGIGASLEPGGIGAGLEPDGIGASLEPGGLGVGLQPPSTDFGPSLEPGG